MTWMLPTPGPMDKSIADASVRVVLESLARRQPIHWLATPKENHFGRYWEGWIGPVRIGYDEVKRELFAGFPYDPQRDPPATNATWSLKHVLASPETTVEELDFSIAAMLRNWLCWTAAEAAAFPEIVEKYWPAEAFACRESLAPSS